ncbi:hypothetical protein GGR50DRAFT_654918 [Xylaria sp. CBS 124048]|nr:hypothetical protein GGR50DRAFT_654918 [Xylaria sp. CBS 124048]
MAEELSQDIMEILDGDAPNSNRDVEMAEREANEVAERDDTKENSEAPGASQDGAVLPFAEMGDAGEAEPRTTFATYLSSPIVSLIVGSGETATILTAHQALLTLSPFFAEACAAFTIDGSPRHVELPNEELDAVGCFLEYLYTGDYFPKRLPGPERALEPDPSLPAVDESGEHLLRHARVYSIAEKFGMEKLKSLASGKIHCVNSTAKGEIAYARYIYQYTRPDDLTMRGPVINFWASRSHTLRSEADEEFRSLCLEYPQFGYDVLSRVLDEKLKREKLPKAITSNGPSRKRPRHSNV